MSKVTDVQAALNSLIASVLPSYDLLPDSIDPSDNTLLRLEKGYSTSYGNGQNITQDYCAPGDVLIERTFPLILTNVYISNLDPSYRVKLERALMEDLWLVVAALEKNPNLSGVCVDARYQGDTGIEYLEGNDKKFIVIVSDVTIKYSERA